MLEVQSAAKDKADDKRLKREELIARLERLGLPNEALSNRPLEDD